MMIRAREPNLQIWGKEERKKGASGSGSAVNQSQRGVAAAVLVRGKTPFSPALSITHQRFPPHIQSPLASPFHGDVGDVTNNQQPLSSQRDELIMKYVRLCGVAGASSSDMRISSISSREDNNHQEALARYHGLSEKGEKGEKPGYGIHSR